MFWFLIQSFSVYTKAQKVATEIQVGYKYISLTLSYLPNLYTLVTCVIFLKKQMRVSLFRVNKDKKNVVT